MRTYIIKKIFCLVLLIGTGIGAQAQEVYRTKVNRDDIKSLEVKVQGELVSTPCIELNGERSIEISFDALHHSDGRFAYSVVHCDAEWKKSNLVPVEYMRGFQRITLDDYTRSFNTTTDYTNFKLWFPNEYTQLIVSGNYAIQIYEEDAPDKIVFTACFSVVEPLVEIDVTVSGNTLIDFNREHQQVEFAINQKNLNIAFPQTDLKIFVFQNNNRYDMRTNLQPSMLGNRQLQYRQNRELIFEAGNEYRRIEFLTHRYGGMGVESTAFFNPYYHVTLFQDQKRDKKTYLYDQDQNGRFFIHCSGCEDSDSEGDYYVVHFSLASERMPNGKMYLYGDFFNRVLDANSLMEYRTENGAYEKPVLLKTGQYNFQYLFVEDGETKPSFKMTEGNFFETENEYTVAVYYRPAGARYDRLIGYKTISSRNNGQIR